MLPAMGMLLLLALTAALDAAPNLLPNGDFEREFTPATGLAVGVRWLRLHPPNHTKWRIVEPRQKGDWLWRDAPIRIARAAGLELIGSLDRCPNWASSAPAGTPDDGFCTGVGAWLPRDWGEWEAYVAATVERHKSAIRIWEVWNEPDLGDWLIPRPGQTQAQGYHELLQHTCSSSMAWRGRMPGRGSSRVMASPGRTCRRMRP